LSSVVTEGRDPRIGEGFLPSMPRGDPIEIQTAISEAIARLIQCDAPEIGQLEALFALERHAQPVSELLLAQYVGGDAQIGSFEWKAWHSALRLTQSLFQANEYFLQHIRTLSDDAWTEHEPAVQVQLFEHRKLEFLLRFLRYKKRSPELWRQLHETYRVAHERDLINLDAGSEAEARRRSMRKLEQLYLQILLLEAMNSGQFSPREALWAYRWFTRWASGPGLHLVEVSDRLHFEPKGFVLDPASSDGLKRALVAGGNLLYFDSSPLSAMITQEIQSLRDRAALPNQSAPAVRAGQLALLDRLAILFAPNPVNIERRSERKAVSLSVQAIAGFPAIVEELWRNGQKQGAPVLPSATPGNEKTVLSLDVATFSPLFAANGDAGPISLSTSGPFETLPQIWQVKDRSDSGCRMRAQVTNLNHVIPGSLIALRDNESAPWTVSVVRWFRRLMVDHVEIGVEYLGRAPRYVKMAADSDSELANVEAREQRCFAALYLPPSEKYPTMPIKTLLFPTRDFKAGCDVTLLASNAVYRMRLSEPIQQQFEYVWTSFSVVEKAAPPSKTQ
jgi:hypothetical protein